MVYLIIGIAIIFLIETSIISLRLGNVIKELRKLNEEFKKFTDWNYKNLLNTIKERWIET